MIDESFRREFRETFLQLWMIFFAHHEADKLNRCFRIRLRKTSLYLCARCTGIFLGAFFSIYLLNFLFYHAPQLMLKPLVVLLPIPAIVDWLTQHSGMRESNNKIRFLSGLLLGASIGTLAIVRDYTFISLTLLAYGAIIGTILMLLRKRR